MGQFLDGLLWCEECGSPILSDGGGHYVHIGDLNVSRIRRLIRDPLVADHLADWFINLKAECPDCGEVKQPFAGLTKQKFMAYVRTRHGADDFARVVKDLFRSGDGARKGTGDSK